MSGPDNIDNEDSHAIEVMEEGSACKKDSLQHTVKKQTRFFLSQQSSTITTRNEHDSLYLSSIYANYPLVQSMAKYESIR